MTKNDFPPPLHKEETGTGAQLLWKINGAARCRDSGEGDQPMVLFTMLEEDKAAIRGAWDGHKQEFIEYKIT